MTWNQGGEFVAAGGAGLQHGPVDVALDGADRKRQSLGGRAVGQSLTDEHHDLCFPVSQRHSFGCLTKYRCTRAALGREGICTCGASQRRSPFISATIREGGMSGGIDGRDE